MSRRARQLPLFLAFPKPVGARFTDEQHAELLALAKALDLSLGGVIRAACALLLRDQVEFKDTTLEAWVKERLARPNRTHVNLSFLQFTKLKKIAYDTERPLSHVIEQAIDEFLGRAR